MIVLIMVIAVLIMLGVEVNQEDQYILNARRNSGVCQVHYASEGHSLVSYRSC